MRIAVTGAAGYIGGWLMRSLAERGHDAHGQDRAPGCDALFDLADKRARQAWLTAIRPDLVIHLAALYGRIWGENDLIATAAANAGLTAALARDTVSAGARLMFVSSSEVYGATANNPGPIMPQMPLEPLNMYGLSKKWGEEACRLYAPGGLMITRLNMPYGPAAVLPEPGVIPAFSGRAGMLGYNALHTMLWQAHHGLPITVDRGCRRCFTFVADACRGLAMIAESGKGGVWNVCRNDDHITTAELARRCVALVPGCTSELTEQDPHGHITPNKVLDNGELWQLGWRPEVALDEGLQETLGYMSMFDREGRWRE